MAVEYYVRILELGVLKWNEWRQSHPGDSPLIDNMDLTGRDLSGIDFHDAGLYFSDLAGADLTGANLNDAHIEKVSLKGARLEGADLRTGYLRTASLEGASYDTSTIWPEGFDPTKAGAVFKRSYDVRGD